MAAIPVTISCDWRPFEDAMDSVHELLDARPEFVKFFLGLLDSSAELGRFESQPATGAHLSVLLKPTDLFLDFLAALRAINSKVSVVEKAHD